METKSFVDYRANSFGRTDPFLPIFLSIMFLYSCFVSPFCPESSAPLSGAYLKPSLGTSGGETLGRTIEDGTIRQKH